jgi:predicted nucleic acid-binding protein
MNEANDSFFVDTNVLLYALSANEPEKRGSARAWLTLLWDAAAGRVSWQVVHESYSKAVQKLGVPRAVARSAVEQVLEWNPELPGPATLRRAWHWCDEAQINFWDAMIVAAAEQAGCRWLLSEDFQAGRRFGMVTVVNPFRSRPSEFGLSGKLATTEGRGDVLRQPARRPRPPVARA